MQLGSWIWIIPLAPLIGAILVGIFGAKVFKERSHIFIITGVAISAALSLIVLAIVNGTHPEHGETVQAVGVAGYDWITVGGLQSLIHASIDPLTAIMLAMVSVVSLFVVIYSNGYMAGDSGYFRFFAYLGLFVFSMLMLILSDNFLMLYVFWEAVGLCSYLLIGYYYTKPSAAAAAKKAFLVNRVGDFGFAIGILLIVLNFKTISFDAVFTAVSDPAFREANAGLLTAIALCLFTGACGKSAQLPLHIWLPDAMEGPSPVSALIHAATMVTAGVYMTVRCGAIFTASPIAMTVVAIVGGITALFAATIALVQTDVKRILAYSTVSQLGYMFLAVGVGSAVAGVFHLYTHAFFKALLFLAAGSIMHAMHNKIDLKEFGGLKKDIPVTHWTFLIGSMALAGVPLLAGFFSKDMILAAALNHHELSWLGWLAVLTAAMTAFYTFRCYFLVFHGPRFLPDDVHHPHESKIMNFSLLVLSIGAIFAGYAGVFGGHGDHGGGWISSFLGRSESVAFFSSLGEGAHHGMSHGVVAAISIAVVVLGIGLAWAIYGRTRETATRLAAGGLAPIHKVLLNKWYVDELYDYVIIRPLRKVGDVCFDTDNHLIDRIIKIVAGTPKVCGWFISVFFQRGVLQSYALWMLVGMAIMMYYVLKQI
jgi:NADH-quinone oxidoreductase subunit L